MMTDPAAENSTEGKKEATEKVVIPFEELVKMINDRAEELAIEQEPSENSLPFANWRKAEQDILEKYRNAWITFSE
ncbi:MAG: hypothetical protein JW768_00600 [Chitinispirillaceae bacterium]|nr:hypothetical protein [Chitinispirillaceae bacterium]